MEAGGYILNVTPIRRETLLEAINDTGRIAEPVPEFSYSRNRALTCFLSFEDGLVTHLAKGRRGFRAGTDLSRLNLSEILTLSKPVAYEDIGHQCPSRLLHHIQKRFNEGGVLPPASFMAFVDSFRSLSNESKPMLDRFSSERREKIGRLSVHSKFALAEQKEALLTALSIAKIDRAVAQTWDPPDTPDNISFLDGLSNVGVREDAMVFADLFNIPGFDLIKSKPYGAAVFKNSDTILTTILANRMNLEEQLGVDLIYCNETLNSVLLVQYKAMESANGKDIFRFPEEQLTKEILRMDNVSAKLSIMPASVDRLNFRLNEDPFYLKIGPRISLDPDDSGMAKGMYIPLSYWKRIERDDTLKGPRGGRSLSYENVGRYISNSLFIDLASGGWIGTSGSRSIFLKDVISDILISKRSLLCKRPVKAA